MINGSHSAATVRGSVESCGATEFAKQSSGMETTVATIDGVVVGFCTIRIESPQRAEVLYLYIDSAQRGAGIGPPRIHRAERRVAAMHPRIASLYLDTAVPDHNVASGSA
jgi:hypothetical protein